MTVRRYRAGDEQQIQALFEKVFKHKRSLSHWQWKFINTPTTTNPFILVFEEEGEILGHISLWVHDAFVDGKRTKLGLRVDTMVDPDAQGKGIYRKLNEHLFPEAKKDGISYVYGFPAAKAKQLFQRYTGAFHMTDMPRLVYVLRPLTLLSTKFSIMKVFSGFDRLVAAIRLGKFTKQSRNGEVREVEKFDQTFDQLAERLRNRYPVQLVRDAAYLNWRYREHPDYQYHVLGYYEKQELLGYLVYKIERNEQKGFTNGLIMDLVVDENKQEVIQKELLAIAMKKMSKVDMVQAWSLPSMELYDLLKKHGFIHKDSPVPLVGKEVTGTKTYASDYTNWFITTGDVDSF
ncbi:GNAT family N-acetyltransferase [Aquibacillus sediminis]|uniref:GNAT family N-acetyltransferase n=1 Tax=Aquibacillus sediminis TaxID=2574734 RepID=UPI001FE6D0A2|nr:GNAT family N-acetyltransferase [Aquibacillus sediminis]